MIRFEFSCAISTGLFFFSSRRRHTRLQGDWSSDVCSSDLFSGTLYVGLTDDLGKRVNEHKLGIMNCFTKRYGVNRLMYFEVLRDQKFAEAQIGRASCRERV